MKIRSTVGQENQFGYGGTLPLEEMGPLKALFEGERPAWMFNREDAPARIRIEWPNGDVQVLETVPE